MNSVLLVAGGVALLNIYALLLVLLRAPVFRTRLYRPMVLNIGLSVAPALVLGLAGLGMLVAVALSSRVILLSVLVVSGIIWVLLLPNSAYLITELNFSHRRQEEGVPLWYDIVLVLTLALSGVMNTLLNVLLVQTMYALVRYPNEARPLQRVDSWLIVIVVLVLVTFGMYLGRYLRFNSWDITHPGSFLGKLAEHFRTPGKVREALGFCVVHTVLLAVMYVVVVAPAVDVL
ncbi:MAG TPA: DUF1361 domain-containing protein [Ruania sp.]|nr:DUF1361 domain-containing protein [Ruania sp.]